mmetsp:Transcript_4017/g.11601  ORF Transcript_4017/g.11601 Transcript_4017/m.11601 type:complete len:276 (+) Transcript_4017:378-1205(+)
MTVCRCVRWLPRAVVAREALPRFLSPVSSGCGCPDIQEGIGWQVRVDLHAQRTLDFKEQCGIHFSHFQQEAVSLVLGRGTPPCATDGLQKVIASVELKECYHRQLIAEQSSAEEVRETDVKLGLELGQLSPELTRVGPTAQPPEDSGHVCGPNVRYELLLDHEVAVVLADLHEGLDDDGKEEVEDEQKHDEQEQDCEHGHVRSVIPAVEELGGKHHLKLRRQRRLDRGVLFPLGPEPPRRHRSETTEHQADKDGSVPEIVQSPGKRASEDCQPWM